MFPAPLSVLTYKDFSIVSNIDKKYADLLKIEYDYCDTHEKEIIEKAYSVYKIGCNKKHYLNYTCCDFKALEMAYLNYINK